MRNYRYILSVAGLLALAPLCSAAKEGASLASKHVEFGNSALEVADFERAVEHYETALRAEPESKNLIYSLGVLYLQTDQAAKAVPLFVRYLELFPMDKDGLAALANAYILNSEPEKAVRLLSQAYSADKQNEAVRRNLGYAQLQAGETAKAVATLESLLGDCPSNRLTRLDLGCAYAAAGETDKALGMLRSALKMYPDAEGRMIYSDLLESKAGAEVDKAAELFRQNDLAGAAELLEPVCRRYPDYARAWTLLGHSLNLKHPPERERAEKAYRAALEAGRYVPISREDYAVIFDNLGSIMLRSGKPAEAETLYRQGISQESAYAPVYFNFGLLRACAGAGTEAALALMEAVRRDRGMEAYIASHPKLAQFRATTDYTNLINSIHKELDKQ